MKPMPTDDTKKKILDLAENLLLNRGYNGFSYKNIASVLAIKNASIHYHFPTKKDLGVAVIQRARDQLNTWIQFASEKNLSSAEFLDQFFGAFIQLLQTENNICLKGALETDYHTLPLEMQKETSLYASELIQWITELLTKGREEGVFVFSGSPKDKGLLVLSSLQGAVQMARSCDENVLFRVQHQLKLELGL